MNLSANQFAELNNLTLDLRVSMLAIEMFDKRIQLENPLQIFRSIIYAAQ